MRSAKERAREQAETRRLRILATVDSIPKGRVSTYGRIAAEAGIPRGARQVGRALRHLDAAVPWHRVVNAAGRSSIPGPGGAEQRRRLAAEGIEFRPSGSIDLKRFGWPK
ncbi:MAG: MGMT family protein [Planctomycetota bacterium]|nr:MGMT family protein [Planctomycetota bacterium]